MPMSGIIASIRLRRRLAVENDPVIEGRHRQWMLGQPDIEVSILFLGVWPIASGGLDLDGEIICARERGATEGQAMRSRGNQSRRLAPAAWRTGAVHGDQEQAFL